MQEEERNEENPNAGASKATPAAGNRPANDLPAVSTIAAETTASEMMDSSTTGILNVVRERSSDAYQDATALKIAKFNANTASQKSGDATTHPSNHSKHKHNNSNGDPLRNTTTSAVPATFSRSNPTTEPMAADTSEMDSSTGILNMVRARSSDAHQDATASKLAKFNANTTSTSSQQKNKDNGTVAAARINVSSRAIVQVPAATTTFILEHQQLLEAEEQTTAKVVAPPEESTEFLMNVVGKSSGPTAAAVPSSQRLAGAALLAIEVPESLPATTPPQQTSQPGAYSGAPGQALERRHQLLRSLVGAQSDTEDEDEDDDELASATMGIQELPEEGGEVGSTSDIDPLSSAGSLTVAALIDEESSFMEAEPVDLEAAKTRESIHNQKTRWSLVVVALFVIAVSVTIVFVVGNNPKNREEDYHDGIMMPSPSPSLSASEIPSEAPTGVLDILIRNLPARTLENLNNASTPQWQALTWLENHPDLPAMPEWKKQQLFVLVTFYYSMDGNNWPDDIQKNWLQYEEDECLWFSGRFGSIGDDGQYEIARGYDILGDPCDDQGKFETLILFFLGPPSSSIIGSRRRRRSIPPQIGMLTALSALSLPLNHLSGNIEDFLPSELYQMTRLQYLNLHRNQLSGSIPMELTSMESLDNLRLAGNLLTGTIPWEMGLLTKMTELLLWTNSLSGTIPSALAGSTNTTLLSLTDNNLGGSIPSELGTMTSMTALWLSQNNLNGTMPTELGLMGNLSEFSLGINEFAGPIPSQLGLLSNMLGFSANNNKLSGSIPSELGMLTSTTELWLNNNGLEGTLPSEVGEWSSMRQLWLYTNGISGTIPSEVGLMGNISQLSLSDNKLTGPIPTELGFMDSIFGFSANSNQLSGSIPSELGLMGSVELLFLHLNDLTGSLPSQLGLLTSMTSFSVRMNNFEGTIPLELELLTNLEIFRLENNSFTGSIPPGLGVVAATNDSLTTMGLENNFLSGRMPESLCDLGLFDVSLSRGISFDCSDQLCGCCWCPCLESNYTGDCQTDPFIPSRDDAAWPGQFPAPLNTSNVITINIFTDSYPGGLSLELSQLNEPSSWHIVGSKAGFTANSINSWTMEMESNSLYRFQLTDRWGDGVCCWYGLGWFTITGGDPSTDSPEGSVIWEATGNVLEYSLDVFIWVDANGWGHYAEYIPGIGYTVLHAKAQNQELVVLVAEPDIQNSTNKTVHAVKIEP